MNLLRLFLFAFISFSFYASNAQVTVYNNFGQGHDGWDYNYGLGWTISGDSVQAQYGVEQAMGFEASIAGFVTDIWVAISYVPSSSPADTVIIRLVENPLGLPPDTAYIMEEWVLTDFDDWYQWNEPIHLVAGNTSELLDGQSYWLWAHAKDKTWTMWCMNENSSLTCPHTIRREGEDWLSISDETASVFRIDVSQGVGINEENKEDQMGTLSQNYPNPFENETRIPYSLSADSRVRLVIYDLLGNEVNTLVNAYQQEGDHLVEWDAKNLSPGNYVIMLQADDQLIDIKKMTCVR